MSFQEPDKSMLIAYSGWAISKKSDASAEQSLALSKFQDGCESLANCLPEVTIQKIVYHDLPPKVEMPRQEDVSISAGSFQVIPKEVIASMGMNLSESSTCTHRFHIATQRCVFCGKTYLEAKGRLPELM